MKWAATESRFYHGDRILSIIQNSSMDSVWFLQQMACESSYIYVLSRRMQYGINENIENQESRALRHTPFSFCKCLTDLMLKPTHAV